MGPLKINEQKNALFYRDLFKNPAAYFLNKVNLILKFWLHISNVSYNFFNLNICIVLTWAYHAERFHYFTVVVEIAVV